MTYSPFFKPPVMGAVFHKMMKPSKKRRSRYFDRDLDFTLCFKFILAADMGWYLFLFWSPMYDYSSRLALMDYFWSFAEATANY